jgi:hypothetical protein
MKSTIWAKTSQTLVAFVIAAGLLIFMPASAVAAQKDNSAEKAERAERNGDRADRKAERDKNREERRREKENNQQPPCQCCCKKC